MIFKSSLLIPFFSPTWPSPSGMYSELSLLLVTGTAYGPYCVHQVISHGKRPTTETFLTSLVSNSASIPLVQMLLHIPSILSGRSTPSLAPKIDVPEYAVILDIGFLPPHEKRLACVMDHFHTASTLTNDSLTHESWSAVAC